MDKDIITTESLVAPKKTAAKKSAAKEKLVESKADSATEEVVSTSKTKKNKQDLNLVIFESGASYSTDGLRFTKQDRIQEVTAEQAAFLLSLDNFRRPEDSEVEEYLASKED